MLRQSGTFQTSLLMKHLNYFKAFSPYLTLIILLNALVLSDGSNKKIKSKNSFLMGVKDKVSRC